ncbi:MAG: uroporphyrinogen-III synthase [Candidatus Methanoplasma sp.]|jgi:uroporphyrinogen-III synthase|nr:uroporphyrinogen-III synthase [Candidatus Methanoplasma sp.]
MTLLAFTRPANKLDESVKLAESMGFQVLAAPSLESSPGDPKEFDRFRSKIKKMKVPFVIFVSGTAVTEFRNYFGDDAAKLLNRCRVVSIGTGTTKYLGEMHIDPYEPNEFNSDGIADLLEDVVDGRDVFIIRSDKGSNVLRERLEGYGATVDEIISYRLRSCGITPEIETILESDPDVIAFTSPLSARSFFDIASDYLGNDDFLAERYVAAIGRPTADELMDLDVDVAIVPARTTFEDLLNAIQEFFKE